jgi:prevent-host-death family protein
MATVNIHAAKTHLSRLVEAAERGEETVIARAGRPVAKLVPIAPAQAEKRVLGLLEGKLIIFDEFDDPLPDDILDAFEGR